MIKPASLRAAISNACPWFAQNPENLHVFIEDGLFRSTLSGGLSSEYNYTLVLVITDYAEDPDRLFISIVAWLRVHQPDMLENYDRQRENFAFAVDYLDNQKCDIEIKLRALTERVLVDVEDTDGEGGVAVQIRHAVEPPTDPDAGIRWELKE
jgi:hypothetical protein